MEENHEVKREKVRSIPIEQIGDFPIICSRSKTMSRCKSHAIAICDDRYHGCNDFSRGSVDIHPDNDLNE